MPRPTVIQQPIEAIISDLDATIIDSQELGLQTVTTAAKSLGVDLSEDELYRLKFAWHHSYEAQCDWFDTFCDRRGVELASFLTSYREQFQIGIAEVAFLAHVETTLPALAVRYPVAINTDSGLEHTVAALGSRLDCFDLLMTNDEHLIHKPDPTSYRNTARHLGVQPSRCLVLEDSYVGVTAAREAGMVVVGVRAGHGDMHQQLDGAHYVVGDVSELPALLRHQSIGRQLGPSHLANWGGVDLRITSYAANCVPDRGLVTSAAVIAHQPDGSMLMVKHQLRGWDVPGGRRDVIDGTLEDSRNTAIRELWEEAGARVDGLQLIGYDKLEVIGDPPADYAYPHPVSYQVFYTGRVTSITPRASNDEIADADFLSTSDVRSTTWGASHQPLCNEALKAVGMITSNTRAVSLAK